MRPPFYGGRHDGRRRSGVGGRRATDVDLGAKQSRSGMPAAGIPNRPADFLCWSLPTWCYIVGLRTRRARKAKIYTVREVVKFPWPAKPAWTHQERVTHAFDSHHTKFDVYEELRSIETFKIEIN